MSNKALITINSEKIYLNLVMVLVPLMNFLSGIAIDMYAPSMPAIAFSFHTSMMAVKNTITFTMFGFAIGCILCGILFDTLGRRKVIIIALIIFIISSLCAPFCHSVYQLMAVRFVQGLMTSAMSIGCRALVADHFTGQRFVIAILYASFAYGLGPVIGPFIGGYLQYHFGWQANFYAFSFFGFFVLILFVLFVHERFKKIAGYTLLQAVTFYKTVLTHKAFLYGTFIFGLIQLELMIYPTLGPFLVQHQLHYSPITYGNSALVVGLGYLGGTLCNRFLLKFFSQKQLIHMGFFILTTAAIMLFLFSIFIGLRLWTLVLPISLIGYAVGFIYGNMLSSCLRLFPNNVGISSATLLFFLMFFAATGVFIISSIKITTLYNLFFVCFGIIAIQLFIYIFLFRKTINIEI